MAFAVNAQDWKWKIKLNSKTLVSTSNEDEKVNTKKISSIEWKKNGLLELSFEPTNDNGFWIYSFQFDDEKGNQLFNADSTTKVTMPLAKLRKLFAGKKNVKIYMVQRPSNPDIMVRVRRVHLYTLMLP